MYDVGIKIQNFNPTILYIVKTKHVEKEYEKCHYHDFAALTYIISGKCTYCINNTTYNVKKGDILIFNPGIYHERILNGDDKTTEFHIGFKNIFVKGLPPNHLINNSSSPIISLSKYELDFDECCKEILLEQKKNEPGSSLILKALSMKLIAIFLKETYSNKNTDKNNGFTFEYFDRKNIVNSIITYINNNYSKNVSLNNISKNMYLSPVYISKVFKDETGETPINYLIKIRLSKALELLKEDKLAIKDIAKSVGYDDAYYFSKLFKKYYGYAPSKHPKKGIYISKGTKSP